MRLSKPPYLNIWVFWVSWPIFNNGAPPRIAPLSLWGVRAVSCLCQVSGSSVWFKSSEPSSPYITGVRTVSIFSALSQTYFQWVLGSTRVALESSRKWMDGWMMSLYINKKYIKIVFNVDWQNNIMVLLMGKHGICVCIMSVCIKICYLKCVDMHEGVRQCVKMTVWMNTWKRVTITTTIIIARVGLVSGFAHRIQWTSLNRFDYVRTGWSGVRYYETCSNLKMNYISSLCWWCQTQPVLH